MTGRVVCECARDEPDVTMSCQGADPGMRGRWDWYTVLWLFDDDDPFIVLTETKFSFRCIPVWIGTLLTGLGSKKKTHVIVFSP